jgi:hypothetical protein
MYYVRVSVGTNSLRCVVNIYIMVPVGINSLSCVVNI